MKICDCFKIFWGFYCCSRGEKENSTHRDNVRATLRTLWRFYRLIPLFLCTGIVPKLAKHVIRVLGDPINVRSFQCHFLNIYSGARGRFLWRTCQLYKAVKMIKVPVGNHEREEKERPREGSKAKRREHRQTCRETGRHQAMGYKHKSRQRVWFLIRRHISPLRMTHHASQAGPYTVAFGTNYTL